MKNENQSEKLYRRWQVVFLDRLRLTQILEGKVRILNLPPDAIVDKLEADLPRDGFSFLVASASFPEVFPGSSAPELLPEFEETA